MENVSAPIPQANSPKRSSFIKWSLVFAIAIVTNLFITYAVQVLYPEPQYEDFCPQKQVNKALSDEATCVSMGGQWNENVMNEKAPFPEPAGYCNEDFTCSQTYQDSYSLYNRNVFVVFVVGGVILLASSVFLTGSSAASLGLSFAGVLALIIGSIRYWSDMDDILRVALLGIALGSLLGIAWKKFRD